MLVTALRLAYLARWCPYNLIEDEAHYWEWSRRLDWSYYSKGPGIALLIRAGAAAFGDTEFGVRAGAALCAGAAMLLLAGLAGDIFRSGRATLLAAALAALIPAFQAAGLIMTIDPPYLACWAAAAWAAWRALFRGSRGAWAAAGLAIGAGFLFKYTIVLLVPGILIACLLARAHLRPAPRWRARAALACVLAAAGLVPVVVWNAAHGWATARHLLGHLGLASGDFPQEQITDAARHYTPVWTLEFLGSQLALIGPAIVLMAIGAARAWRARRSGEPAAGPLFCLACAAPVLAFYLILSFFTEVEGNWPLAGYLTLVPLAASAAAEGIDERRRRVRDWLAIPPAQRPWRGVLTRRPETPAHAAWVLTVLCGLVVALGALRLDLLADSAPVRWAEAALRDRGVLKEGRRLIPVGRFMGAPTMAAAVLDLEAELRRRTGLEPFVIAEHYGRASVLAFYLPGHPVVYCASEALGGRRTQYDLWPDADLHDARLLGRPAVMMGTGQGNWAAGFESVEEVGTLPGDGKRSRPAFRGIGYRGFPAASSGGN